MQQFDNKTILEYLKTHKDIVNDFIISEGLYNVYIRNDDGYIRLDDPTDDTALVASCSTFKLAEQWIIDNGRDCIGEQKDNCGRPALLTIIHQKNYDLGEVDYPTDYSHNYMIGAKRYPTYAFSKSDYLIALREHTKAVQYDMCDIIIPTWIFRIKKNGDIIKGCTKDYVVNLLATFGDGEWKDEQLKDCDTYYNPVV
jgi:hypothetical protein